MKLTAQQQQYIASRAQWYFDVTISPRNSPTALGDNCVFTGQGLSDLNRTIGFVSVSSTFFTPVRIICEAGGAGQISAGNAFPQYLPVDIQDLYAIKDAYIAYYGSVDRPSSYRSFGGGAFQTSNGTVLKPVAIQGTAAPLNSDPSSFVQNG